jgi:signal transduction histidine kinase
MVYTFQMRRLLTASMIGWSLYQISIFFGTQFAFHGVPSNWDSCISTSSLSVYTIAFINLSIRWIASYDSHHHDVTSEVDLRILDLVMLGISILGDVLIITGYSPTIVSTSGHRVYLSRLVSSACLAGMSMYTIEAESACAFYLPMKSVLRVSSHVLAVSVGILCYFCDGLLFVVVLVCFMILQLSCTTSLVQEVHEKLHVSRDAVERFPEEPTLVPELRDAREAICNYGACIRSWHRVLSYVMSRGFLFILFVLEITGLISSDVHFLVETVVNGTVNTTTRQFLVARRQLHSSRVDSSNHEIEKLRLSQQKVHSFLRFIFHEIRIPLNTISLGLDQLVDTCNDEDSETIDEMYASVQSMSSTLDMSLMLQKAEAGLFTVEPMVCDVYEMIESTIAMFRTVSTVNRCPIILDTTVVPAGTIIKVDCRHIKTILRNFLSNALKYSVRGCDIKVHFGVMADSTLYIDVSNEGNPVNEVDLKKLFRAFSQLRTGDHSPDIDSSSGLGLAICRMLATAMDGSVDAQCLDRIITFSLRIPYIVCTHPTSPKRRLSHKKMNRTPSNTQRNVALVVDDMSTNRKLTAQILTRRLHMPSITAASGLECLSVLRSRNDITMLLLDNMMPGMSGVQVAQHIRRDHCLKHLLIIGVTGNAMPDDIQEFLDAGADHVLTKPLDITMLQTILRNRPSTLE